jgi:hypothetical protein
MPTVNANPPAQGMITDDPRYNERAGLGHVVWMPSPTNLWSVSADPTSGPLANVGKVGDFAFRTDTAGAVNRLYVKTAATTWTLVI